MLELIGYLLMFIIVYLYIKTYINFLKIRAKMNNRSYNYLQEITYLNIFEIGFLNLFPISFILNYLGLNDKIVLKCKELMESKVKNELILWTTILIGICISFFVIIE
jgi:hypothetical protein